MQRNEKGFSAVEVIPLLAVEALVGVMGWVLWLRHDTKQTVNINAEGQICRAAGTLEDYYNAATEISQANTKILAAAADIKALANQ